MVLLHISLVFLAADSQTMLVFLPGGHAAPDMALRLVHIQNNPRLGGQAGVDVGQAVGDVCWCPIRNKKFYSICEDVFSTESFSSNFASLVKLL